MADGSQLLADPSVRAVSALADIMKEGFAAQEKTLVEHGKEFRNLNTRITSVETRLDRLETKLDEQGRTQDEHGRILKQILQKVNQ